MPFSLIPEGFPPGCAYLEWSIKLVLKEPAFASDHIWKCARVWLGPQLIYFASESAQNKIDVKRKSILVPGVHHVLETSINAILKRQTSKI